MNSEVLFYVLSIILQVCIGEGTNKLFQNQKNQIQFNSIQFNENENENNYRLMANS